VRFSRSEAGDDTHTIPPLAIIAAQAVMQGAAVISNELTEQELDHVRRTREAKRTARLQAADLPDWSKELFERVDKD